MLKGMGLCSIIKLVTMRKLFTSIITVLLTVSMFAQTPQKMSYQAVIRDAENKLVTDQYVGMRISILQNSLPVYSETQTPKTNANGLVSIEFGGGDGFDTINWADGIYFIKTETDPEGGNNYTIVGRSQMLSVPYALHAMTADVIMGEKSKHFVGELFGGGVVFYVSSNGQHGLICSMVDLSSAISWAPKTFQSTLIGPTVQSEWNGNDNTGSLISQIGSDNSYAAGLCRAYANADYGTGTFSDWYLPAADELNKMYQARYEISKALETDGIIETTTIAKNFYWSSTEYNNLGAWYFSFYEGIAEVFNKKDEFYVRAVRAF